jgi:photosystem II stability/assembly factor-like uncharacterized protein
MSTGLPPGGIPALVLDAPSTLYAVTATGVFKTTNGGTLWGAASNGLPGGIGEITALALDPSDTGTLYAGTATLGVYKTTNGGGSWTTASTGLAAPVRALAVHPDTSDTVYAGTAVQGVFRTTNGGASWTTRNAGLWAVEIRALAFDPTSPDTLYAAGDGYGIAKTTDGGASWTMINAGLTSLGVSALAVHPTEPDTLYAATAPGGIFKSTDGGASWSLKTSGSFFCVAFPPLDPETIYAGSSAYFYKIPNDWHSWTGWGWAGASMRALAVHPGDPDVVYIGTAQHGVYKFTNSGFPVAVNTGLSNPAILSLALDPQAPETLYAGTDGGGVFKTVNGGGAWTALGGALPGSVVSVVAVNPFNHTVYAGTDAGGVFQSRDGGTTWTALGTGLAPRQVKALAFSGTSRTAVYAAGQGGVAALLEAYGPVALLAPSGTIIPAWPTFTWSAAPGAIAYYLRFEDSSASLRSVSMLASEAGCAAGTGTCRYTLPGQPLEAGPARWWAVALYQDGMGTLGDGLAFTIAQPTLGAPTGITLDPTPTYTWTALPGAAYYCLWAADSDPAGTSETWYTAAQAGCASGTGTCRITPTTPLAPGAVHWAVQAWNSGGYGPWSDVKGFQVHRLPAVPTARAQRQADGTTPIPLGGTATSTTVVFRATVSDPDAGQKVRLQVEVKPVGTAFTGSVSCYSVLVNSGTPATCKVTGLALGRYHWRVRAKDSLNAVSAWASYATNAESAADFIVSTAPGLPTGRGQYQANGTTPITLGGTATSTTVVFRATVSDPDAGQKVRLQVEVKPVGTAFTGAVSRSSVLVSSGTAATCAVTGLARGTSYHWRLRAMDALGIPSAWVSYATNPESAADFKVAP